MIVVPLNNILLKSCSYLVDTDDLWLIDCGGLISVIEAFIRKGKELKGIFITHCHHDHISGLPWILEQFPNISIYCSQATLEGLKNEDHNLSYILSENPFEFTQEERVIIIKEGVQIVKGLNVEIISTPGHSDDCMTYIINDCIFTGDSYIPFAKVFAKWPRSNKVLAIENEKKIINLINERQLKVYPGHWE